MNVLIHRQNQSSVSKYFHSAFYFFTFFTMWWWGKKLVEKLMRCKLHPFAGEDHVQILKI